MTIKNLIAQCDKNMAALEIRRYGEYVSDKEQVTAKGYFRFLTIKLNGDIWVQVWHNGSCLVNKKEG